MQIFAHYIEPLTSWLHHNPHAALFFTFLIAFLESVAIIGSIIPGSVTMTAIGILAGTGVIRIDLTILSATLGAIAGDGFSYLIGYYFSDRLTSLWPFSHYPNLFAYGQHYFEKHGGKSVLIGRFVGPLRSIIPVIAGMMHMPQWRFFVANVLSGLGWAILYITPGILIGSASHELSPERAARLVVFVLIALISIWLLSLGIKSLYLHLRTWFQKVIHKWWAWCLHKPMTKPIFILLTPKHEKNHTTTAILIFLLILTTISAALITNLRFNYHILNNINHSAHFLIQSMRAPSFELFFTIAHQSLQLIPVISLFILTCIHLVLERSRLSAFQWVVFAIIVFLTIHYFHLLLPQGILSQPHGILGQKSDVLFPATDFTLAATCYLGVLFHNQQSSYLYSQPIFSAALIFSIFFGGLAELYLGEIWLSDLIASFLIASTLTLIYWIWYRKTHPYYHPHSSLFSITGLGVFILSASLSCYLHLNQAIQNHQVYFTQHVISHAFWWSQDKPLLPIYSRNRIGKISGTFNIQYVGNIKTLEQTLRKNGWKTQKPSLLHSVLKRVGDKPALPTLPLSDCIYLNHPAIITMVYHQPKTNVTLRLQLWRSNYYLESFRSVIWIGHIQLLHYYKHIITLSQDKAVNKLSQQLLQGFTLKKIVFQESNSLALPHLHNNEVLLIKANGG